MKTSKWLTVLIILLLTPFISYQQEYDLQLEITNADVSGLNAGDTVSLRVYLSSITNGDTLEALGYDFSFRYDTAYLSFVDFAGFNDTVFVGAPTGCIFEVNQDTIGISWFIPTFCCLYIPEGTHFFDIRFIYKGGLADSTEIVWNQCNIINEFFESFNSNCNNGIIYKLFNSTNEFNIKASPFSIKMIGNNEMTVLNKQNTEASLYLFDLSGHLILSKQISPGRNIIGLNIPANIYILQITSSESKYTTKLFITR